MLNWLKDTLLFAVICFIVFGSIGLAASFAGNASSGTIKEVHLVGPAATAFTVRVNHPKKITLYPEGTKPKTTTTTFCVVKDTQVAQLTRHFTTPYTRDVLYKMPKNPDYCYVTVGFSIDKGKGFVGLDASTHG